MTANPERGETKVTIQGVEYVLAWTFNSLIALQQEFKTDGVAPKVEELFRRAQDDDHEVSRVIFWCMFTRHHPEVTLEQAGDMITDLGGLAFINALLSEALTTSAPTPEDTAALGGGTNPRKAAKATGRRGRSGGRLT